MTLREWVFDLLKVDPTLNDAGITEQTLYPNYSPDQARASDRRFLVLRWSETTPFMRTQTGRVRLELWAYDREPDFGGIETILRRSRELILPVAGLRLSGGTSIVEVEDNGEGPDFWDDGYNASARNWNCTITRRTP